MALFRGAAPLNATALLPAFLFREVFL